MSSSAYSQAPGGSAGGAPISQESQGKRRRKHRSQKKKRENEAAMNASATTATNETEGSAGQADEPAADAPEVQDPAVQQTAVVEEPAAIKEMERGLSPGAVPTQVLSSSPGSSHPRDISGELTAGLEATALAENERAGTTTRGRPPPIPGSLSPQVTSVGDERNSSDSAALSGHNDSAAKDKEETPKPAGSAGSGELLLEGDATTKGSGDGEMENKGERKQSEMLASATQVKEEAEGTRENNKNIISVAPETQLTSADDNKIDNDDDKSYNTMAPGSDDINEYNRQHIKKWRTEAETYRARYDEAVKYCDGYTKDINELQKKLEQEQVGHKKTQQDLRTSLFNNKSLEDRVQRDDIEIKDLKKQIEATNKANSKLKSDIEDNRLEIRELGKTVEQRGDGLTFAADELRAIKSERDQLMASLEQITFNEQAATQALNDAADREMMLIEELKSIKEVHDEGIRDTPRYLDLLAQEGNFPPQQNEMEKKSVEFTKSLKQELGSLLDSVVDEFKVGGEDDAGDDPEDDVGDDAGTSDTQHPLDSFDPHADFKKADEIPHVPSSPVGIAEQSLPGGVMPPSTVKIPGIKPSSGTSLGGKVATAEGEKPKDTAAPAEGVAQGGGDAKPPVEMAAQDKGSQDSKTPAAEAVQGGGGAPPPAGGDGEVADDRNPSKYPLFLHNPFKCLYIVVHEFFRLVWYWLVFLYNVVVNGHLRTLRIKSPIIFGNRAYQETPRPNIPRDSVIWINLLSFFVLVAGLVQGGRYLHADFQCKTMWTNSNAVTQAAIFDWRHEQITTRLTKIHQLSDGISHYLDPAQLVTLASHQNKTALVKYLNSVAIQIPQSDHTQPFVPTQHLNQVEPSSHFDQPKAQDTLEPQLHAKPTSHEDEAMDQEQSEAQIQAEPQVSTESNSQSNQGELQDPAAVEFQLPNWRWAKLTWYYIKSIKRVIPRGSWGPEEVPQPWDEPWDPLPE